MKMDLPNVYYSDQASNLLIDLKKGVGAYLRVATDSQSSRLQKHMIKNWVSRSGFSWDEEIEVFNELPANQVIENRPELMRLLQAIQEGKIKVVIVYSRDQLARNFYEYMEIVQTFMRHKVKVVYVGETAPTNPV